ncbi:Rad21/Rec8 N terminal domain protein [Aspergillus candidus]|uniref:Rec8 like protein-domain-containing protein n=1 Tax=Aspergillus candidus TaxID=41067 RepID=A0A2I2FEJ4_ASPCN|nr:Rec8 like protein-domain-containing protein [Aspergillus candidus]PLB39061.1 Rec8 like protein-domain-containing protein [Aspergillus candidus]
MFYSHEILTSPEHGVATIWLVATLGSKSITRKLNRKAILDVDVTRACGVIKDPEAPMALRLQGNLLYGVSRVHNQQCGYTLTDVQAVHDRMRSLLRVMSGGGLDPSAGKARPEQLILPYDPTFLPETNLPGLGLDLSSLILSENKTLSQQSSMLLPATPDLHQSSLALSTSPRLSFSSSDIAMRDWGRFGSDTDATGFVQSGHGLVGIASSAFEEGGVLLQPDFEFDEDGNIVELGPRRASEITRHRESDTPIPREYDHNPLHDLSTQAMAVDDEMVMVVQEPSGSSRAQSSTDQPVVPVLEEKEVETETAQASNRVSTGRGKRQPRPILSDEQIALRNTELAGLNNGYVENMAAAVKQKSYSKQSAQAKKNAILWVYGLGIGSVGAGVGASQYQHPLQCFSGDALFEALSGKTQRKTLKRKQPFELEHDSDSEARRVRAKEEEYEEEMGRGEQVEDEDFWRENVEIGRQASSVIHDGHSQMPWNVTASVQSSRFGSSIANAFRGFRSASDVSSRPMPHSVGSFGTDLDIAQLQGGRSRSQASTSPLAGRSLPFDIDALTGLDLEANDLANLEDLDLGDYLQTNHYSDQNAGVEGVQGRNQLDSQNTHLSTLDQESVNFLEFLTVKIDGQMTASTHGPGGTASSGVKQITFSALIPPESSSRAVATHGLMHTLTLATKGFIIVAQEPYEDHSSEEHGTRYRYGEIHLQLLGA